MSEIAVNSQKRARVEDVEDVVTSSTDESPAKKLKMTSPSYLLCGVGAGSPGTFEGELFTPTSSEGEQVVETLFALTGPLRSRAIASLTKNLSRDNDLFHPDVDLIAESEWKEFKQLFPFIMEYSSVAALGTLDEWRFDDRTSIIPIYGAREG